MHGLQRSTVGCTWCKAGRRKCDETKPQCLRCLASGKPCSYEYVEYSGSRGHRVKRTKPAPRGTQKNPGVSNNSNEIIITSFTPSDSGDSAMPTHLIHPESRNKIHPSSGSSMSRSIGNSSSLPSIPPVPARLFPDTAPANTSLPSSDLIQLLGIQHTSNLIPVTDTSGPIPRTLADLSLDGDPVNGDPEDVHLVVCMTPTVDKNVKDNTLPFVLYCYSQWAIAIIFEPLKIMHTVRDQVIAHFSSGDTRARTILIANVMNMFVRNFAIDDTKTSLLHRLALDADKCGAAFMTTPRSSVPALDRQNAIRALDGTLEILALQLDMRPASDYLRLMDNAVPLVRRACPGPPGRSINLPNLLLDFNLNLRSFATIDVMLSLLTGQPTHFRYEVPFSLELCDRIYHWQLQGNYGSQWLYGIPDQFILLFAWINTLSETRETSNNLQPVTWIETNLSQIKVAVDESGDPALRINRAAVQESWRLAVLIYLYMVLCKTNAHDPRVIRIQKSYMRLVKAIKPGRNPDYHLAISMCVAGVVTIKEGDRSVIRQRILGVREYAVQGTCGNNIILALEDIWSRTRDEGRAAVWSDLATAYSRLTGS